MAKDLSAQDPELAGMAWMRVHAGGKERSNGQRPGAAGGLPNEVGELGTCEEGPAQDLENPGTEVGVGRGREGAKREGGGRGEEGEVLSRPQGMRFHRSYVVWVISL